MDLTVADRSVKTLTNTTSFALAIPILTWPT